MSDYVVTLTCEHCKAIVPVSPDGKLRAHWREFTSEAERRMNRLCVYSGSGTDRGRRCEGSDESVLLRAICAYIDAKFEELGATQ